MEEQRPGVLVKCEARLEHGAAFHLDYSTARAARKAGNTTKSGPRAAAAALVQT